MQKIILTVLFGFILSNLTYGQHFEKNFKKIVDSTYQENKDAVGIMVHIEAPKQDISWSYAVGYTNKKTKENLDKQQPVLIASNTKTYVSASLLKLVELNKISLDQPIKNLIYKKSRKRLKKNGYDVNKITIRHLLSHTSGITDYVTDDYFSFVNNNPNYQWTREEQIDLAMKIAKPVESGKTFAYGDINYLLLTEIIEKETGKPFYIAIRELLNFDKHNLNTTWFADLEKAPKSILPFANQYTSKFVNSSININPSWDLFGGGGLASTAKDLALFFQLLFEGEIIEDKNVLAEIYTNVIPQGKSNKYCLGLYNLQSFYGEVAYYHGGFWGTDAIYFPEYNATITVFTLNKEKREINPVLANKLLTILKQ